jgi:pantetheine-phosphate adenylyltransferase
MKRIAVFPGSFDPFTLGHLSIVQKALPLFDEIVVGIGENSDKKYFFSLDDRKRFIRFAFREVPQVSVESYSDLTVDFCREKSARFILRGLRNPADFDFERNIAQMNHALMPEVETIFIVTDPALSAISSTIVREIIRHGGDANAFVPMGMLSS